MGKRNFILFMAWLWGLIFCGLASAQTDELPVSDLGQREIGQTYPLKLTGVNVNCQTPQDFEFQLDNMPWLTTNGPAVIRGVAPGASASLQATMDFQYTPIGEHYGRVTSRCITCGWHIFASCVENGEDVVLKVTVTDPALQDQAIPKSRNPYTGMRPVKPINVKLDPPISDDDVKLLSDKQKKKLMEARSDLKTAELNGKKAQDNLRAAQKKKSDCERELARLKSEAEAADRKAGIAEQDAKNAEGAAETAEQSLADFEEDNEKALKAIEDTMRAVLVASDYRSQVAAQDGTGSGRYKRAQEQVDRFNAEHFDALREHSAVSKSRDARKKAAEQARKDADAAKTNAENARTAANNAKAKYEAKARECAGLGKAQKKAQDELDDAKSAAIDAVKDSNKAEKKASGQAFDNIPSAIRDLEKERKQCEADLKKRTNFLKRMFQALRNINVINPNKVSQKDVDVEGMVDDFYKSLVAQGAAEATEKGFKAIGGKAVPTFEVFTALDALQAAYGIIAIKQLTLTPNRAIYRGDENLKDFLEKKDHAKDGPEAEKMVSEITKFIEKRGNTDHLTKEIQNKMKECHNIAKEIARLQAKKAAGKSR